MKSAVLCLVLLVTLSFCSGGNPKMETRELVISESLKIGSFPAKVIQYGAEKSFVLSKLEITVDGSQLKGTLHLKNVSGTEQEFLFFMYIVGEKHMTMVYFTPKIRQTFVTPKGSMGDVGLSAEGYELKGDLFSFDMPTSVYGIYDTDDVTGHVYVFCVSDNKETQVKDASWSAISNVLETDI